jgi:ribosomal protein S17E
VARLEPLHPLCYNSYRSIKEELVETIIVTTWMTLVKWVIETNFTATFTKKELMEKGLEAFTTHYPNNKNYGASVSTQLTKMVREGYLVRTGKGVYNINKVEQMELEV